MHRKLELEHFVRTTMNREDSDYRVQLIYEEYGTSSKRMVQTSNINEKTITSVLEFIAEEVLLGERKFAHVLVLLAFCIELDQHCKSKQFPWYSKENLTEIIVNVLWKVDFVPPPSLYSFKICNIL